MKNLRAKNVDLAQRLEANLHYGEAVQDTEVKATEAEKKRLEVKGQLVKVQADVERLREELYETECQVATLVRRLDHTMSTTVWQQRLWRPLTRRESS